MVGLALLILLSACTASNDAEQLRGTAWSDGQGRTLSFNEDGTFHVRLQNNLKRDRGTYETSEDIVTMHTEDGIVHPCTGDTARYRLVFNGRSTFTFEVIEDECTHRTEAIESTVYQRAEQDQP